MYVGLLFRMLNEKGVNGICVFDYISIDFFDICFVYIIEELVVCMLDWDINDVLMFEGESVDFLVIKLIIYFE